MTKRIGSKRLREVIEQTGGVISEVARTFDVSRQTVYNWLEKYPELLPLVIEAREYMVQMAERNVYKAVLDKDLEMSKFVLERLGKTKGWAKNVELTGRDGEPLNLSPEVVQMLAAMGVEVSDAVREFEALIRRQHAKEVTPPPTPPHSDGEGRKMDGEA